MKCLNPDIYIYKSINVKITKKGIKFTITANKKIFRIK